MKATWLDRWAAVAPNKCALKDPERGREYSYLQAARAAHRISRWLQNVHQIKAGDRVAVVAQNELEHLLLFFALQEFGGILVPLNYRLAADELKEILNDCEPRLIVVHDQFANCIEKLQDQIDLAPRVSLGSSIHSIRSIAEDESLEVFSQAPDEMAPPSDEISMILYTSGTTGRSKGVIITEKMLFWNALHALLHLNLVQDDTTLTFLPFYHTGGWNVLTLPLLFRGGTVISISHFEADLVLDLCIQEKVSVFFTVPTTLERMTRLPSFAEADLKQMRYVVVGGEALPHELISEWEMKGVPVRQGYGLTEFGPNVFSLSEKNSLRKIGSIGVPNVFVQVQIDGGADEGELLLRGPVSTPGYWKNETETAALLRDGWLHTGDIVRRDSEGFYYIVGRKKEMFISGGENVYPAEVERALRAHPGILEAAVVGVPDSEWGEVGKAFVVCNPARSLKDPAELIKFCRERLAKYKVPKCIEFVAELPKGPTGKILKRKLAS